MSELVSILIPAYNAEKWITQTVKSALAQTWPRKEIIIVDDGSTDNTLKIARKLESKTVKVITQQNTGASGARNKALSFAQGDYIQWLDADDLLAPDKISHQLKDGEITNNSDILISSSYARFYYRHQKATFIPNVLWQDLTPVEWLLKKFYENAWMNPAVWLVSRKLTNLAGLWNERLSLDDDGEYFSRLVSVSEKVKFIPEAKCYYRIGNLGSLSRRTSDKACKSLVLSLSLCINYLRSLEESERSRIACIEYLQTWYNYFYPEKSALRREIEALAYELGGNLLPVDINWKYSPVKIFFGWKVAKKLMDNLRKSKLLAFKNWDRFLYTISPK